MISKTIFILFMLKTAKLYESKRYLRKQISKLDRTVNISFKYILKLRKEDHTFSVFQNRARINEDVI